MEAPSPVASCVRRVALPTVVGASDAGSAQAGSSHAITRSTTHASLHVSIMPDARDA